MYGREMGEVMGKWECKWRGQLEKSCWKKKGKKEKRVIALGLGLGQ